MPLDVVSTATTTPGACSVTVTSTTGCSSWRNAFQRRGHGPPKTWQRAATPANGVLAAAFRLLDLGFLRVGGEQYADENSSALERAAAETDDESPYLHGTVERAVLRLLVLTLDGGS